jgi:hypothetical protein
MFPKVAQNTVKYFIVIAHEPSAKRETKSSGNSSARSSWYRLLKLSRLRISEGEARTWYSSEFSEN